MSTVPNHPDNAGRTIVVTVSENVHEVRCPHCSLVEVWENRHHAEAAARRHVCADPAGITFRHELEQLRFEIAELQSSMAAMSAEVRTRRLVVVDELDVERVTATAAGAHAELRVFGRCSPGADEQTPVHAGIDADDVAAWLYVSAAGNVAAAMSAEAQQTDDGARAHGRLDVEHFTVAGPSSSTSTSITGQGITAARLAIVDIDGLERIFTRTDPSMASIDVSWLNAEGWESTASLYAGDELGGEAGLAVVAAGHVAATLSSLTDSTPPEGMSRRLTPPSVSADLTLESVSWGRASGPSEDTTVSVGAGGIVVAGPAGTSCAVLEAVSGE